MAQKRHIASWAARRKMQGVTEALTSTWKTVSSRNSAVSRRLVQPILTMLLGMLPLMVATGAGANGSRSLASCVVGGMVLGILALLFLVPALFIIFQWLQERLMPREMVA